MPPDFYPALPVGLRWGLLFIWQSAEDGHADDSAPGETFRTSWGITEMLLADAIAKGILPQVPIGSLSQQQAATVYLGEFWQAMLLDEFPVSIGFCLFCDATLTGSGHVARLLQRIVGAPEDGVIGRIETVPATQRFLAVRSETILVEALIDADEQYEAALANAPKFINGWRRREIEEENWALELIQGAAPEQPKDATA
jgi:lysozyme family protein